MSNRECESRWTEGDAVTDLPEISLSGPLGEKREEILPTDLFMVYLGFVSKERVILFWSYQGPYMHTKKTLESIVKY